MKLGWTGPADGNIPWTHQEVSDPTLDEENEGIGDDSGGPSTAWTGGHLFMISQGPSAQLSRIICAKSGNPITIADGDIGIHYPSRMARLFPSPITATRPNSLLRLPWNPRSPPSRSYTTIPSFPESLATLWRVRSAPLVFPPLAPFQLTQTPPRRLMQVASA
ncbi:hypothetical protein ACJZ2D_011914 [Fusarium nematophilum]